MHANLRQLLSLRDGAPVDALCREHVASCRHCQRELEQLASVTRALRALPDRRPPASAWAAIRARLDQPSSRRRSLRQRLHDWLRGIDRDWDAGSLRQAVFEGVLASGVAVAALACLRLWPLPLETGAPSAQAAMSSTFAQQRHVSAAPPALDQLLSRVHAQEALLARLPAPGGDDPDAAARRQALKDRIALLDHYCLTAKNLTPEVEFAIMLERATLMDQLLDDYDVRQAVPASLRY